MHENAVLAITEELLREHPTGAISTRSRGLHALDLVWSGTDPAPCQAPCPVLHPEFSAAVFALVNSHRASIGRSQLVIDPRLQACIEWKNLNCAANLYMDHDDHAPPLERLVAQRLAVYYPTNAAWGENLAYGYVDPQSVMDGWLADFGHKENIENSSWVSIGVAVAQDAGTGLIFWGQDFGGGALPDSPVPLISGIVPAAGQVGSRFAIRGVNLGHTTSVVFVGDGSGNKSAQIVSVAAGEVDALVPSGATSGSIAITTSDGRTAIAGPFAVSPNPVPSGHVLQDWLTKVLPLIQATSQYDKWLSATSKQGAADAAAWKKFVASPHGPAPAMSTPYGKALVADLSLAAAQP